MKPSLTATEVSAILTSTAIDIMAPGVDRDSGYGIADALAAVAAVGAAPRAALYLQSFAAKEEVGNGNGSIEPGECGSLSVTLVNGSATVAATAISATLTTTMSPEVVQVDVPFATWADLAGGTSAASLTPFRFRLDRRTATCPLVVPFTITVTYVGGTSPLVLRFDLRTGLPPVSVLTTLGTAFPTPPTGLLETATGSQADRILRDGVPSSCAEPKTFPGTYGDSTARLYDSYTLSCSSQARCVNLVLGHLGEALFAAVYAGSFDPADVAKSYVADAGDSTPEMSLSFWAERGETYVIVVNEVYPGEAAGEPYSLTVDGVCLPCTSYRTNYACCTAELPLASLPAGTVGAAYPGATLAPTGGTGPFTFTVSSLPAGMTPAGPVTGSSLALGGTPTKAYAGTVVVSATDTATGCTTQRGYALSVGCPAPPVPLVLTAPASVPAGSPCRTASVPSRAGSTYSWTIGNGTITAGQGTSSITFTAGSAGTPVTLSVAETNAALCPSAPGTASIPVLPIGEGSTLFYTIPPCRIVDTRGSDGPFGGPALAPWSIPGRTFLLPEGTCGVPAGVSAVSANMVVIGPGAPGFLLAGPPGGTAIGASAVDFSAGQTRSNNVFLRLAPDGSGGVQVQSWSSAPAHFVLDLNGYFR